MKILHANWYGLDHALVDKKFKGDLTYIGDNCMEGAYHPWAIYRAANPDRSKGHKDFMLLKINGFGIDGSGAVSGLNLEQMKPYRKVNGLWCLRCDRAIYSCMRHHDQSCKCGSVSIDGGRDYIRVSHGDHSVYVHCTIDLIDKKIRYSKKAYRKAQKNRFKRSKS
jgi:hypothetical protein